MTPEELRVLPVDRVVDARGTRCPGPMLIVKQALVDLPLEGVLEVLCTDENSQTDLDRWCSKLGHDYLGALEDDNHWRLFIRRKK